MTLHTAIPNVGFVRMEHQSVCIHPSTHTGQRRFCFLPTATQHYGVIRVSHHHQPSFTHFNVKLVKVDVGDQGADYSPNAKGNFQFERVIIGWRSTPLVDLRLKK